MMRALSRFALSAAVVLTPVSASPQEQTLLTDFVSSHTTDQTFLEEQISAVQRVTSAGNTNLQKWVHEGTEFIKQNGQVVVLLLTDEYISHPAFEHHHLRVTKPELCDPTIQQASGYLDIADDKHLFYWFFESRTAPAEDPLILWLNGGPGCSSSAGLLFELGPCSIDGDENGLNGTKPNPYSWNTRANIIFLDQPVNVGFSYAENGTDVSTSPVAAEDVYAFLQLFLKRFPQFAQSAFHLAAESYGGVYAPNIASVIYKRNKDLLFAPPFSTNPVQIRLASVILANGLTEPYTQMGSIADYVCDGPYPVFSDPNGPECQSLRAKIPVCQNLIKTCYDFGSNVTCAPAALYCTSQLFGALMETGRNPYDVRFECEKGTDGPDCYPETNWISLWLNDSKVKASLGVDPTRSFESRNAEMNKKFTMQGDPSHDSAILLPEFVNDGVRLLVYAGDADMMCNFIGNERWVSVLETNFLPEFTLAKCLPWITLEGGRVAGAVRSAGGDGLRAGNVTFVRMYEAGHMAPHDQPEAALDLINRWITDVPLSI